MTAAHFHAHASQDRCCTAVTDDPRRPSSPTSGSGTHSAQTASRSRLPRRPTSHVESINLAPTGTPVFDPGPATISPTSPAATAAPSTSCASATPSPA